MSDSTLERVIDSGHSISEFLDEVRNFVVRHYMDARDNDPNGVLITVTSEDRGT